jgi:hypothetical protein
MDSILKFLKDNADIITVGVIWFGSLMTFYKIGLAKGKWTKKKEALENRFNLIYAPLRATLIENHITTAVGMLYPTLFRRLKRAWDKFLSFEIVAGFKAIFDKYGSKRSAEIEFGDGIPYGFIKKTIRDNIKWADPKLVLLAQRVDRAQYEVQREYEMEIIDDEMELIDHIWKMYYKLNKKLLPK